MGEQTEELLALELACDEDAPGTVRGALGRLAPLGWRVGDAMLVASELVTNAVRHSGCTPSHSLRVTASLESQRLRITVEDPGLSAGSAAIRDPSELVFGGMGLLIVDQLADRWGAQRDDRYRVWADLVLA